MSKRRTIFLSAIAGNILEYYDFTVYAIFIAIISKTFFPAESEFLQSLLGLSAFAVGFLTRPIGGILFGYIADKYGRRTSLIISMLGMTIPTFTIGLIPDYTEIGILAPITLVVMRLLQGLCISGEGAGAAIFILEHHQNLRSGLTAGIVHSSNIAGTLLATFIGYIAGKFFSDVEFAWRFAFILGGFLGLAGFYIRLRVSETPIFQMLAERKKTLKAPFFEVIKTSGGAVLITVTLGAAASSIVYLIKTYVNVYQCGILGYNQATSMQYVAYGSLIMMISMPIAGYCSDLFGRLRVTTIAAATSFFLALPALYLLSCESGEHQIIAITILAVLGGFTAGSAYVFVISMFSPAQRFTGVAFSYNLGVALCGGTSALISRTLVEYTDLHYSPAFFIMSTTGIFLIVLYLLRDNVRKRIAANLEEERQSVTKNQ